MDHLAKPFKRTRVDENNNIAGEDSDLEAKPKRRGAVVEAYESDEAPSDSDKSETPESDENDMFAAPKTLEIEGQEWTEAQDKFEPFHMDAELEQGHFDLNGMYVKHSDEMGLHDSWLNGVTKEQMARVTTFELGSKIKGRCPYNRETSGSNRY